MSTLSLTTQIAFKAPEAEVWKGLTDPAMVEQYFFGTKLRSNWTEGAPITFSGEWDGKSYEDKGIIKEIVPGKYVRYSYWSSMAGTEDKPENYADISYELDQMCDITTLTITQDNIKDEESKEHSEKNWRMMFDGLKKLIEK
ncbi:SRPBCC family protein [Mucilaginibacter phyllosphaerae]